MYSACHYLLPIYGNYFTFIFAATNLHTIKENSSLIRRLMSERSASLGMAAVAMVIAILGFAAMCRMRRKLRQASSPTVHASNTDVESSNSSVV